MLNVLRDSFKNTPYLKWLLGLVALSFVLYLGNYFFGNGSGAAAAQWVARVGDAEIPGWKLRDAARNLDREYQQMFGEGYDRLRPQLQIGESALRALIERELILQDARRLGLQATNESVAEVIRTHPSFQDANGQFIGPERYAQLVARAYGGGVTAFEAGLADDLVIDAWSDLVTQPVVVDEAELRDTFGRRTERTTLDYVLLPSAGQPIDTRISDAELQARYDAHQNDYRRGESRRIRFIVVDRQAQRSAVQVSDDDVRTFYEANQQRYAHPEQRRASHILFRVEPGTPEEARAGERDRAEATLRRLREGADLATLARELSMDEATAARGGDLGYFGREDMVAPFAEAAFATAVGDYTPVVETEYGFHVIRVTDARPAGVAPLEEVQSAIRQLVEAQRLEERTRAEAERLAAEIRGGAALQQVADREGLTVETRVVERGDRLADLGASGEFAAAVRNLTPGAVSSPLGVDRGMAVVTLEAIVPPGPAPLEEIRERVSSDILNERTRTAALAAARAALERHGSLEAAARALERELTSSRDIAPGQTLPGTGGTPPELERELFGPEAAVGRQGVVAVPAGALLYRIIGREPFDPQRFAAERADLRQELLSQRRLQYRQGLITGLWKRHEKSGDIRRNDPLIRSLVPGGAAPQGAAIPLPPGTGGS
jgi:peptidyl-prolyl cis-trans isomerase D